MEHFAWILSGAPFLYRFFASVYFLVDISNYHFFNDYNSGNSTTPDTGSGVVRISDAMFRTGSTTCSDESAGIEAAVLEYEFFEREGYLPVIFMKLRGRHV